MMELEEKVIKIMEEIEIASKLKYLNIQKINHNDYRVEVWGGKGVTQKPKKLLDGYQAVYMFFHNDKALKIGIAGSKSNARYQSAHYHYNEKDKSTLAKSLCEDKNTNINKYNCNNWIKNNTYRINILLKSNYDKNTLKTIESIFHAEFKPKYER